MPHNQKEPATLESVRTEVIRLQQMLLQHSDTQDRLWMAGENSINERLARLEQALRHRDDSSARERI